MTLLEAIILGIVEGITEYLPISSTGHLILTKSALGLSGSAVDAFIIVVQGGAILAVLGLYRKRILQMIQGLLGKNQAGRKLLINLIIAFLPAAILGPLLDDKIGEYLFKPIPVIAALAGWGVVMILLGPWQRKIFHKKSDIDKTNAHSFIDIEHLTWRKALIIGLLQCVAMWPGTSRSMMTIVGGMFVGMKPKHAAEFSFLLALPTLGGACVYKGLKNVLGEGPSMFEVLGPTSFIIGTIAATIAAALSVKWLVNYLQKHGVALFGWYRIALSVVFAILLWQEVISL
ncbi:MAG: undecaprenyl-diphosphate phosphatase [Planctomycetes bacterium]|nr:undecaprenyl-diphosphate phosphatase [Planctomycetota bacterium]